MRQGDRGASTMTPERPKPVSEVPTIASKVIEQKKDWTAHWCWTGHVARPWNTYAYFRRAVELPASPRRVVARMALALGCVVVKVLAVKVLLSISGEVGFPPKFRASAEHFRLGIFVHDGTRVFWALGAVQWH